MAWLAALVTAVLTVVVFWLPGMVVARAWGWRGGTPGLVALGPALTIGVLAPAAVVLGGRMRWGVPAAALVVCLAALAGATLRRAVRGAGTPAERRTVRLRLPRGAAGLAAAVTAGTVLQLVPVALAMRRPDAYLAAHDVPFHLAALAHVRETGDGSSLTLRAAAEWLTGPPTFYAAGWHDVAVLVPRWPDPAVVATVAALVPTALAWSLGLAFLARAAFPARPRVAVWAPLLGAAGVATPLLLVMRPEGMIPNALGLALLPSAVAAVLLVVRRPATSGVAVAAVACVGVALTHPNAAATTALAALPAVVVPFVRALRSPRRRVPTLVGSGLVLAAGATVAVVRRTELTFVTSFPAELPLRPVQSLLMLASGNGTEMGWAPGFAVTGLALVGAVLARRLRARVVVAGWAVLCALFLASTSAVPWLTDVDRFWYGEPRRFAPAVGTLAVPLAAFAVDTLLRRLHHRPGLGRVAAMGGACALGLTGVFTAAGLHELARATFVGSPTQPALADAAELDMARRLEATLDPGRTVLGSPFAGTTNLRERTGQAVLPPANIPTGDPAVTYLATHLDELTTDPAVCAAAERLGVGYLYVDPSPWNVVDDVPDLTSAPSRGVRLVDRGGSAAVYEITAC